MLLLLLLLLVLLLLLNHHESFKSGNNGQAEQLAKQLQTIDSQVQAGRVQLAFMLGTNRNQMIIMDEHGYMGINYMRQRARCFVVCIFQSLSFFIPAMIWMISLMLLRKLKLQYQDGENL